MKPLLRILAVVSLLLALAGCRKAPKIIPQNEFGELYAELLLADQWVKTHPSERRVADTSFVYAQILERHGYTDDQVVASMKHYLQDPLRYKRAMEVTVARLERHHNEVETELTIRRHNKEFMDRYHKGNRKDTVWTQPLRTYLTPDSLVFRVPGDTLGWQRQDSLLGLRTGILMRLPDPYPSAARL